MRHVMIGRLGWRLVLLCLVLLPVGVQADEPNPAAESEQRVMFSPKALEAIDFSLAEDACVGGCSKLGLRAGRPTALSVLYVSLGVLQAMDVYTTRLALDQGAVEVNPLLGRIAGSSTGLLAAKAAATAGTVYFAEKVWRKNRLAAIALLAVLNGVTATVVAHNARVIQSLER